MKRTILTFIFISVISLTYGQVETKFYPDKNALEQAKFIQNNAQAPGSRAIVSRGLLNNCSATRCNRAATAQLLKEKKTSLKGRSTKIQTAGWKDGVYLVRVKYKDEILIGKLVVKK